MFKKLCNVMLARIICDVSSSQKRGSSRSNNKIAAFNHWIPAFARMTGKNLSTINQKPSTAQSAFTLVELAIVIVIIGLLLGGVLQGQELIKQAGARNNVKRIQEINAAIATFYAKYNCIPGDCSNAAIFGLGPSGDGDGKITFLATGGHHYFWLHLVSAKMLNITNRDSSAITSTNYSYLAKFRPDKGFQYGYMYPSYGDVYTGTVPGWPWADGGVRMDNLNYNLITITSIITGSSSQYFATFTPEELRIIDEKIDDGNALTGKFYGANARNPAYALTICSNSGIYNITNTENACRALFQIGF
jgi:prepilin-type N-terminal cleavage/methylation domain-containing protein